MSVSRDLPMISLAEYPNKRSASGFQRKIVPLGGDQLQSASREPLRTAAVASRSRADLLLADRVLERFERAFFAGLAPAASPLRVRMSFPPIENLCDPGSRPKPRVTLEWRLWFHP